MSHYDPETHGDDLDKALGAQRVHYRAIAEVGAAPMLLGGAEDSRRP